jgi:hypothetical protein
MRFIQAFTMVMLSATAMAQLMIPVDREFPVPQQLEFRGSWTCESGTDTASLTVGSINRPLRSPRIGPTFRARVKTCNGDFATVTTSRTLFYLKIEDVR